MAFYSSDELQHLGLAAVGREVRIDRTVMINGAPWISIGDNVRIDAFCIVSASERRIVFTGHTHIGAGTYIFANGGDVIFELFASTAPGCRIFTSTDDFTIGYLHGPTIDQEFRKLRHGPVTLRENACLAANVVVLPDCTIGVNATAAAGVVVTKNLPDHTLTYHKIRTEEHEKDPQVYLNVVQKAKQALRARSYGIP